MSAPHLFVSAKSVVLDRPFERAAFGSLYRIEVILRTGPSSTTQFDLNPDEAGLLQEALAATVAHAKAKGG